MKGSKPVGEQLEDARDRRDVLGLREIGDGLEVASEKALGASSRQGCTQEQIFEARVVDRGEANNLENRGFGSSVFDSRDALGTDAGPRRERALRPPSLAPMVAESLPEAPKALGEGLAGGTSLRRRNRHFAANLDEARKEVNPQVQGLAS